MCGPLMSLRVEEDPVWAQLGAERIHSTDVNLHFMQEAKTTDLRDSLGAVRCPTLVIAGEHDPLVPSGLGREIVEAIPDGLARLEVIRGASHDLLIDNPPECYRLVREFLADLP